jgi:hypothetical protein
MIMEKAQALTRLITRFPDIIEHGIPRMGIRVPTIGDARSPTMIPRTGPS